MNHSAAMLYYNERILTAPLPPKEKLLVTFLNEGTSSIHLGGFSTITLQFTQKEF